MKKYIKTEKQGIWLYYPDSRAKHVVIYKYKNGSTTCVCNQDLQEHKGLNGAYFFRGLPGLSDSAGSDETEDTAPSSTPSYNNNFTEVLGGYILT